MLTGRKNEIERLKAAYKSQYSEFVAVTGRRRIGKTFLIREFFNYKFTFQHSGVANQKTRLQLRDFKQSLEKYGLKKCHVPQDWFDAFYMLENLIETSKQKRKVIFIDEMPWLDAPKSNFVSALEHFWNAFASARKDVLLIICGSATSWIINKIYKNYGGLHNRVTCRINLQPFTLSECEQFCKASGIVASRLEILQAYMILGGVPYYWTKFEKTKTVAQNIDYLFFNENAILKDEFRDMYSSLFKNPEAYLKIIETLALKKAGMTREELTSSSQHPSNGTLTRILEDLQSCGFIRKYNFLGLKENKALFQLIDNFTLFYCRFLKDGKYNEENFWSSSSGKTVKSVWEGLAFERVCLLHVPQIKFALGISGISANVFSWYAKNDEVLGAGTQIDMLIDRADNAVNICEMKFWNSEFLITKDYEKNLRNKISRFQLQTKTPKTVRLVLITVLGLKNNIYSDIIQNTLTINDLFKEL